MAHLGESGKLTWHFIVGFRHLHRRVGFQDLPQYIQQAHPHISCHLSSYSIIYPQNYMETQGIILAQMFRYFRGWNLPSALSYFYAGFDEHQHRMEMLYPMLFILDILWDRWSECSLVISHISCGSDLISLLSIANLSSISVKDRLCRR